MRTFSERLKYHLGHTPDRVALILEGSSPPDLPITYSQLLHGAQGFANAFENAGVRSADVVILILQHGEQLIYAYWGAVIHGGIPSIMPFLTQKLSPERYRADL